MNEFVKRQIYKDVFKFIWLPICIFVFSECVEKLLLVRSADIFGSFADTVFALDLSAGLQQVGAFAVVLAWLILVVPALNFISDVILVKFAMAHDRMVLSRFLDKRCDAVGKSDAGDMLNRLDNDPNRLRLELLAVCSSTVIIPVTMTYLVFCVLRISLSYFAIVFAVSLVKFTVPLLVKKTEKKYHREEQEYASAVRGAENDFTNRAHLVNLFGLRQKLIDLQDKRYHVFLEATKRKSLRLHAAVNSVQSFINTLCMMAVLLVGAYYVAVGRISSGDVAAMMGYYSILNKIIDEFSELIRKLPILDNLAERLMYFYEDAEANGDGEEIREFQELQSENFSFSYDARPVFAPCSFTIRDGDKVVVRGQNGSGKSTVMKVMLGLLHGYDGTLTVNGKELSRIHPNTYRCMVAYAPQDPYLFKGTIFDNIKLANPNSDATQIRRLLQAYGISDLAEREIEEGGYELSGGERQKVSIIRAMIKDTPVVFMDEPENNLDAATMGKVKEWICTNDKTVIYVSHDPKLIACANKEIALQ